MSVTASISGCAMCLKVVRVPNLLITNKFQSYEVRFENPRGSVASIYRLNYSGNAGDAENIDTTYNHHQH